MKIGGKLATWEPKKPDFNKNCQHLWHFNITFHLIDLDTWFLDLVPCFWGRGIRCKDLGKCRTIRVTRFWQQGCQNAYFIVSADTNKHRKFGISATKIKNFEKTKHISETVMDLTSSLLTPGTGLCTLRAGLWTLRGGLWTPRDGLWTPRDEPCVIWSLCKGRNMPISVLAVDWAVIVEIRLTKFLIFVALTLDFWWFFGVSQHVKYAFWQPCCRNLAILISPTLS